MTTGIKKKMPEVILFQEPGVRTKNNHEVKKVVKVAPKPTFEESQLNIFDMKKARYEIIKFGISGFEKNKKYKDNISLAIRLGAKPPKRECKNYKTLMEERKRDKELEKMEKRSQVSIQPLKRKKTTRKRKKKE